MMIFLTIIAVIVIFSLLVLIHELGHFVAARRNGIKVLEFGIGFPPRLFKKKIGDTTYSINAIPFGGFVKLYGEDASDPQALNATNSFAHKSAWVRTKVVVAGVVMNFLLAVVLLAFGFMFGIEPLIIDEKDFLANVNSGNVVISSGAYVAKVNDTLKNSGIEPGDKIIAINDLPLTLPEQFALLQKQVPATDIDITVQKPSGETKKVHLPVVTGQKDFGLQLKPYTDFPRLTIFEVKEKSESEKAGLRVGDTILKVNDRIIYSFEDLDVIENEAISDLTYVILRDGKEQTLKVPLPDIRRVVIADIAHLSGADKAGIKKGDVLVSIGAVSVKQPREVQEILKRNKGKQMEIVVLRAGQELKLLATTNDQGMLGVTLSVLKSYKNEEISLYRGSVFTSIVEIKKIRVGPVAAVRQAFSESVRLMGVTVKAFGNTIATIISKFSVPAEIGGPVQIAYYTHAFIQEGFFALLRFTALLSLSLAVINILPIPALDGGRLLFIIIEVVIGKRISPRFEALVHSIGFLLLLLLIGLVTYSDIVKLF